MTPATLAPMPSKGTTRRSIRVPDDEWNAALQAAERAGENLSEEIRKFLRRYVKAAARKPAGTTPAATEGD